VGIDDLRRQLSFKGLQDSDFQQTPLRKFSGRLKEYNPIEDSKYTNADGSARIRVAFVFEDVNPIECAPGQVYVLPMAEITVNYSSKKESKWGYLANSLHRINADMDIADLVGKQQTWGLVSRMLYAGKEKGVIPQDCWEVLELEGVSAGGGADAGNDPRRAALNILFGKTKQEFEAQVLKDPSIKRDGNLVSEIVGNHFIPAMEAAGFVHKDPDGRYQVGPA
jgi:hypothetical protein